jgi:Cupredoxin-like domain
MRMNFAVGRACAANLMLATTLLGPVTALHAEQATVKTSVKDHHFQPAQVYAPANQPLAITVKNLDAAAMEFESVSLRVEKVIAGGGEGVVHVRALAPGSYEFFDDFHQETRGSLVAR